MNSRIRCWAAGMLLALFIHAGKKIGRFQVGRVGAFCPICRDVAVHGLVSVRQQIHVYGVGLGRGKELYEETTCEECGLVQRVESGGFVGFSRAEEKHSLEEVIELSRPDLMESLAERFEMEARLDELTPQERAGLISEGFTCVNYMFQVKSGEILQSGWFAAWLIVFLGGGGGYVFFAGAGRPQTAWTHVFLLMMGIGFLAMIWCAAGVRKRYARRVIAPMLAKCLGPMGLSEGEVEMGMRQMDAKLRRALKRVERH